MKVQFTDTLRAWADTVKSGVELDGESREWLSGELVTAATLIEVRERTQHYRDWTIRLIVAGMFLNSVSILIFAAVAK